MRNIDLLSKIAMINENDFDAISEFELIYLSSDINFLNFFTTDDINEYLKYLYPSAELFEIYSFNNIKDDESLRQVFLNICFSLGANHDIDNVYIKIPKKVSCFNPNITKFDNRDIIVLCERYGLDFKFDVANNTSKIVEVVKQVDEIESINNQDKEVEIDKNLANNNSEKKDKVKPVIKNKSKLDLNRLGLTPQEIKIVYSAFDRDDMSPIYTKYSISNNKAGAKRLFGIAKSIVNNPKNNSYKKQNSSEDKTKPVVSSIISTATKVSFVEYCVDKFGYDLIFGSKNLSKLSINEQFDYCILYIMDKV